MRTERPAAVFRPEGFAGVLDQRQPVAVGDRAQLVELTRIAEHVDRHDRARALRDRRLHRARVEVERDGINVGEDRIRAFEDEAVRRSHEGQGRGDHLVSGPETGDLAEQVQSTSATRHGGGERGPDAVGDLLLEAVDPGTERQASGPQHLEHELFLPLVEPRPGERDLPERFGHAPAGARSVVAYSSQ